MKDRIFQYIKNNKIPVNLFKSPKNNLQYMLGMTIFNMNQNIKYIVNLTQQSFHKLIIRNSLQSRYPTFQLQFNDMQGIYTNLMRQTGEYIRIVIVPPESSQTQKQKNIKMDMMFTIQSHEIMAIDNKYVRYKIMGKFWTARNLGMHINFATGINKYQSNMVSPYVLIYNILKKINYPLNKTYIPDTTQKIYYINDQNNTVNDVIDYCLWLGCGKDDPPTFLYHHILDNQPVLYNRTFIKKDSALQVVKQLELMTGDKINSEGKHFSRQCQIVSADIFSMNQTQQHYQQKSLHIEWEFNHLTRKWIQNIITPNKIDQLLTVNDKKIKILKTSFYPQTFQQSNIRYYQPNWHKDIYDRLKDLQIGINNISIGIEGSIYRQVGQVINVNTSNKNYINALGGEWQVYSIAHIFQNNEYINKIIGYRTYNGNLKPDQEKNGKN